MLIADDHAVVRRGLSEILQDSYELTDLGEAATCAEALEQVRNEEWDVVVLDLTMPGPGGLEALKQIKQLKPRLPVLVLSVHSEEQYAVRALRAGAAGYLTKECAPQELVQALHRVIHGGKYLSQDVAELLAGELLDPGQGPPHQRLSDRELQVLRMLGSGMRVKDIAETLSLSEKTVSTYRRRLLDKMEMNSNAELIRYAISNGLTD